MKRHTDDHESGQCRSPRLLSAAAALVLGLSTLASPVAAQEAEPGADPAPQEAFDRLAQQYGAEVADQVREIVRSTENAGGPGRPVLDKALEGTAKGVPTDRLLPVLGQLSERLVRVRSLLGDRASTGSVVAGANALQQGVPGEALRAVGRRTEDAAIPLVVLGELSASGVPVDHARGLVEEALDRGQQGQRLLNLSAAVGQLISRGRPPEQALNAVREAVQQGRPPSSVPGVGNLPDGPPDRGGGPPSGGGPPGTGG